MTCCNDVTVDFFGTIDPIQAYKGSFSFDPDLTETAGIPVYKKNDDVVRCLWLAKEMSIKKWIMGICEDSGSNGGYGNISLKAFIYFQTLRKIANFS